VVPGVPSLPQTILFEQLADVLCALARRRPVVLLLDNLQWAEAGAVALLSHLARRMADGRFLAVGAYRPGCLAPNQNESGHSLESVVNDLRRALGDILVNLDVSDGRRLVDVLLDAEANSLDESFRDAVYQYTGGNPLFVLDLLQELKESGALVQDRAGCWVQGGSLEFESLPPRAEAVAAERVGRLSAELLGTLKVACVEGETFTVEVVARALEVGEEALVHRLSDALGRQHHLVVAQGVHRVHVGHGRQRRVLRLSRYRFRHGLIHRYLYDCLDEVERARLHEAVGKALEAVFGGHSEAAAMQVARHFEIAGLPGIGQGCRDPAHEW
jgi:predicted ATPase